MKRIVVHWTAGGHKANAVDREHYHVLIEGDGNVVLGSRGPEANESTKDGDYSAHVRALNTGSIGVALCAMREAKERPFSAGPSPITDAQLDALADVLADLTASYGIPIDRRHVLTHAEVQPTLGVAQRGKWDITWLPGMKGAGDPIQVGDSIRAAARAAAAPLSGAERPKAPIGEVATDGEAGGSLGGIAALVTAIFGGVAGLSEEVQLAAIGVALVLMLAVFWKRLRKLI